MIICKFILTILFLFDSECLFIYDTVTKNVEDIGKLLVFYYLKDFDIFHINYGDKAGCDDPQNGKLPEYYMCDVFFYAISYSTNDTIVEKVHFVIDNYSNLQHHFINLPNKYTVGNYLTYLSVDKNHFIDYQRRLFNTLHTIRNYKICFETGAYEVYGTYYTYFNRWWCTEPEMKTLSLRIEKFVQGNNADALFIYEKETTCDADYYGITCWYYCQNDFRRNCQCDKKRPTSTESCTIKCNNGWVYLNTLYVLSYTSFLMRDCVITDLCYFDTVCRPLNQTCFQFDNVTKHCFSLDFTLFRQINTSLIPLNSTIVFYLDRIFVNITKFPHENLKTNYSIQINTNTISFVRGIFKLLFGYDLPSFIVNSKMLIDSAVEFVVTGFWYSFNSKYTLITKFRIFVRPTYVRLIETINNSKVIKYIYHGQIIKCESDSRPLYRSIFMWKTRLTKEYFKDDIIINKSIPIQSYILYCEVSLIVSPIDAVIKYGYAFIVSLRPYVYFGWNVTENILTPEVVTACRSKDYVYAKLKVVQLEGSSQIDEKPILYFFYSIGGHYKFICIWSNQIGTIVIRTLDFKLRRKPLEICLLLFAATPGGIIQCSHNGYINDEYLVELKVNLISNSQEKLVSGLDLIRLPYNYDYNSIIVNCYVKNIFDEINYLNYSKPFNIFRTSYQTYIVSKEFKICPNYIKYEEKPIIINYIDNTVDIAHKIYYYKYLSTSKWYMIFIIFVCFGLIDIMAICVSSVLYITSQRNTITSMNHQRMKSMKMRNFNDRMHKAVYNILAAPPSKSKFSSIHFSSMISNPI